MPDRTPERGLDEKLAEHRACMRGVSELEAFLDVPLDSGDRWARGLSRTLAELSATFREHFRVEEQEALFRDLPTLKPRFAARLARLETEHGQMLGEIDRLIAKVESPGALRGTHEQREVRGLVQLLVAKIRRHEAEENEILIAAHWEDLGVGG